MSPVTLLPLFGKDFTSMAPNTEPGVPTTVELGFLWKGASAPDIQAFVNNNIEFGKAARNMGGEFLPDFPGILRVG